MIKDMAANVLTATLGLVFLGAIAICMIKDSLRE